MDAQQIHPQCGAAVLHLLVESVPDNTGHIHSVCFNLKSRPTATCAKTEIRVHCLRFSRKQMADGFKGTGPMNDLFDTMQLHGNIQPKSYSTHTHAHTAPDAIPDMNRRLDKFECRIGAWRSSKETSWSKACRLTSVASRTYRSQARPSEQGPS